MNEQTNNQKARTIRLYMSREEYEVTKIALKLFLYRQSNNHDRTDADTAQTVLERIEDCERLQISNCLKRRGKNMMDREKLIEICETLLVSCKEQYCAACCLARLDYPRCRATYMADRIDGFDSFEAFCEYLKKCADMEDTISRQKAEIERLKKEIEDISEDAEWQKMNSREWKNIAKDWEGIYNELNNRVKELINE